MHRRYCWTLLCLALTFGLVAATLHAQQSDRAKEIGGKLLCGVGTPLCDCKQILTQCNHVGCRNSSGMLKKLDAGVASGASEASIVQGFVAEFGTAVLSEPPHSGLNLVAWYLPGVLLALGALLVVFVISRWRKRPALVAAGTGGAASDFSTEHFSAGHFSAEQMARARAQAARETQD